MASHQPARGQAWHGRTVLGLGAVSFLTDTHSEAILALLPQFMRSVLGLSMAGIGFIEGVAEAVVAGVQLLSGWLSDRLAVRKPIVLGGYCLSTLAKATLAMASAGWHVLAVRAADRVGKGLRTPPRDAMLADAVARAQWGRAYGLHRAMDTGGAIAGTLLAMVLFALTASYSLTFAWAAVFGALAVAVLVLFVPETAPAGSRTQRRISLSGLPAGFWVFAASYGVFAAANVTYAFFLLRCQELGLAEVLIPAVYLGHNVVYALAALPMGGLADRIGARAATMATFLGLAAIAAGLAAVPGLAAAIILTAAWGAVRAGQGSAVRALAVELAPEHLRASAVAIYRALGGLAALPGGVIVGAVWDAAGAPAAWALVAAMALLACLLLAAVGRKRAPGPG